MSTTQEAVMATDLPAASELIAAVRAALDAGTDPAVVLDPLAPAIDALVDAEQAGAYLGLSRASVYRERCRTNPDGSPRWPASDVPAGRSGLWTYRTLVTHRAKMQRQRPAVTAAQAKMQVSGT
jgi:hypothetical protein